MESEPISEHIVYADDPELLGLSRKSWVSSYVFESNRKITLRREVWQWLRTHRIKYHVGYYYAPTEIRNDKYRWRLICRGQALKGLCLTNALGFFNECLCDLIPGISFELSDDLAFFKLTWL